MGQSQSKKSKPQNVKRISKVAGPEASKAGPQAASPVTFVGGPASNKIKPPADAVVLASGPSRWLAETERNMAGAAIHSLKLYRLVPKVDDAPALERVGRSLSCSVCGNPASLECSGCRSSRYCSSECRGKDWPIHEHLCYMLEDFVARPPCLTSGRRFVRVVVFPAGSVLPRFDWIQCSLDGPADDSGRLLGVRPAQAARMPILPQHMAGGARDRSIHIGFRAKFDSDGSIPNKSIEEATQGRAATKWRGNVVAVRFDNTGTSSVHGDMTMEDFRQVVLFFLSASLTASPPAPPMAPLPTSPATVVEIDEAIGATDCLASGMDSVIQADFDSWSDRCGCEEILLLDKAAISELLYRVVQDDEVAGFRSRQTITHQGDEHQPPYVQLNSIDDKSFRPYRIAKRQDGQLVLYGHAALYRSKRALHRAKNPSVTPSAADLIIELIDIDHTVGSLLPPEGSDFRRRIHSIGSALNDAGGMRLMLEAHDAIRDKLGRIRARELECAWDGVGDWLG